MPAILQIYAWQNFVLHLWICSFRQLKS